MSAGKVDLFDAACVLECSPYLRAARGFVLFKTASRLCEKQFALIRAKDRRVKKQNLPNEPKLKNLQTLENQTETQISRHFGAKNEPIFSVFLRPTWRRK